MTAGPVGQDFGGRADRWPGMQNLTAVAFDGLGLTAKMISDPSGRRAGWVLTSVPPEVLEHGPDPFAVHAVHLAARA